MGLSKFLKGGYDMATFTPDPADAPDNNFIDFEFDTGNDAVQEGDPGDVGNKPEANEEATEDVNDIAAEVKQGMDQASEPTAPDTRPDVASAGVSVGRVVGGARIPTPGDKRKHVLGIALEGASKKVRATSEAGPPIKEKVPRKKRKASQHFTSADFALGDEDPERAPATIQKTATSKTHASKKDGAGKEVFTVASSDEESSKTPIYLGRDIAYEENVQGLFVPPFSRLEHSSLLDNPDDRLDYVRNIMVPKKMQGVGAYNDQQFIDYANHSLIELITSQAEYLQRFTMASEHRFRLLRENGQLKRKVESFEKDEQHIRRGEQFEGLQKEITAKNVEIASLRERVKGLEKIELEKNETRELYDLEVKRVEELEAGLVAEQVKVSELSGSVQNLKIEKDSLEENTARLSARATELAMDKENLVTGLPSIIRKFLKSDEFNLEMGIVQGLAMDAGGHRAMEHLRNRFGSRLDVNRLEDYKPEAFDKLIAAADQMADKEYPFLSRLAMSSDMSAADILKVEPDSLPDLDA